MEKEILSLSKQKEDEVTWSKIDNLFLRITEGINTKEEAKGLLHPSKDLLVRSILSDRSKLSGTAIGLLKKFVELLERQMEFINEILPALLKVCGRSNRIVSRRGQDAIVHICKFIDLPPHSKILLEFASSTNKNVRLAVFKALEVSKEIPKILDKVILKGKDDPFHEVRTIAKAISEGKCNLIVTEPIKSKETTSRINFIPFKETKTMPTITNSPLRKVFKLENKANEKIYELEQKVKAISNHQVTKNKVQKIVESYKTRDLLSTIPKKEKEVHDDLTPKKLDRFLSKYRNVYGNVLEEKKVEIIENKPEIATDTIKKNNNSSEETKPKEVVIQKDDTFVIESENDWKNDIISPTCTEETISPTCNEETIVISTGEIEPQRDSPVFNIESLSSKVEESGDAKNTIENILDDYNNNEEHSLEKGIESLSIVIEDELPSLNSNQIDYTIVNSGVDCSTLKCPPFEQNNSNRFSPLLVAKKEDECLIFDITEEDTNCKTPKTTVKEGTFTSPMDVPVVAKALSSSFLYSKQEEEDSEDFTQIDSVIYADKKTFTRDNK